MPVAYVTTTGKFPAANYPVSVDSHEWSERNIQSLIYRVRTLLDDNAAASTLRTPGTEQMSIAQYAKLLGFETFAFRFVNGAGGNETHQLC